MNRVAAVFIAVACLIGSYVPSAIAAAPATLRLYVFDCGIIRSNHPEFFGVTMDEVGGNADMPVPCYLIRHSKGTVLFETGLGDFRRGKPPEEFHGLTHEVPQTLVSQLSKIGLSPENINIVALSHFHYDHVGNLELFPHARVLIQRAELDDVRAHVPQYVPPSALARLDLPGITPVNGDYDIFGDGSVVLIFTPGHTPGHQSLLVTLKNSGPILLTGDLYHYQAEEELGIVPDREKNTESASSRARVAALLAERKGQLWIGHEISRYNATRKAPAFYD